MIRATPASGPVPQDGADARRSGTGPIPSSALAARYKPVIAILSADRSVQTERITALWRVILEARDAEALASKGVFTLAPGRPSARDLLQTYQPIIAILMASRERQFQAIARMKQQIREARDAELMARRRVGEGVPGRPVPLVSERTAALVKPRKKKGRAG